MRPALPGVPRGVTACLGICLCLVLPPAAAADCSAQTVVRQASPAEIADFVNDKGLQVLTFAGYSGAGYEDPAAMLAHAAAVLAEHDPARTLVNIGATEAGIGAVYALARARGFATMGIVSTRARDEHVRLSPCVDWVFFVADRTWGGWLDKTGQLSPTSAAIVEVSDVLVGIGGGAVAAAELSTAQRAGKPVRFFAADMNHAKTRRQARRKGLPVPTDLRGEAHHLLLGT